MSISPIFLITLLSIFIWAHHFCNAAHIFTLQMHHRFSQPVRKWSESFPNFPAADNNWPPKDSIDYYSQLANHDRAFHDRRLSGSGDPLTFADGNSTFRISSLGFLHYTTVSLGTPGLKFMVALDTGSDLFWVPCDCSRCASIENIAYSEFKLSIYSPQGSSTSKKVPCSHRRCTLQNSCSRAISDCPYTVSYVSSETSTSGILVEDVLHLKTEDSDAESFEAYITFGCGQVQSGSFLDVAAPNGLFGLGFEKISVPSILAQEGYTADSFSMCFGHDGTGRISFGDKGSLDQEETPFNMHPHHPTYNVSVTRLRVGATLIDSDFTALFDSGTSFTYLVNPAYARLSQSFDAQTQDRRHPPDSRIPFEFCYDMSPDANTSLIPTVSFTMKGGSQLSIYDPIIVISTQHEVVYCLAVIKSSELNIIGQNFMTGYRIVFDREKLVLGWKKFNCYDIEDSSAFPLKPPKSSNVPPAVAAGLGNHTNSKSSKKTRSKNSVASLLYTKYTCYLIHTCLQILVSLFLSL